MCSSDLYWNKVGKSTIYTVMTIILVQIDEDQNFCLLYTSPNSESQGKDSVDLIRNSLFSIQVKQPWLLLQCGNSDVESIGADRVESLL